MKFGTGVPYEKRLSSISELSENQLLYCLTLLKQVYESPIVITIFLKFDTQDFRLIPLMEYEFRSNQSTKNVKEMLFYLLFSQRIRPQQFIGSEFHESWRCRNRTLLRDVNEFFSPYFPHSLSDLRKIRYN
jgi:hypothetical protein